jgi:hypothetical protein
MSIDTSFDKCRAPSTLESRYADAFCSRTVRGDQFSNKLNQKSLAKSYLQNRSTAVFPDENSAPNTRQRRIGREPGATPRGSVPRTCIALKGRRNPAPFQASPFDSQTQGVALGLHPAALSAPQARSRKSEFTFFDASLSDYETTSSNV